MSLSGLERHASVFAFHSVKTTEKRKNFSKLIPIRFCILIQSALKWTLLLCPLDMHRTHDGWRRPESVGLLIVFNLLLCCVIFRSDFGDGLNYLRWIIGEQRKKLILTEVNVTKNTFHVGACRSGLKSLWTVAGWLAGWWKKLNMFDNRAGYWCLCLLRGFPSN